MIAQLQQHPRLNFKKANGQRAFAFLDEGSLMFQQAEAFSPRKLAKINGLLQLATRGTARHLLLKQARYGALGCILHALGRLGAVPVVATTNSLPWEEVLGQGTFYAKPEAKPNVRIIDSFASATVSDIASYLQTVVKLNADELAYASERLAGRLRNAQLFIYQLFEHQHGDSSEQKRAASKDKKDKKERDSFSSTDGEYEAVREPVRLAVHASIKRMRADLLPQVEASVKAVGGDLGCSMCC